MKSIKIYAILMMFIVLSGCAALFHWREAEIYPMSYDQTYLMTTTALDGMGDWRLVQTDYNHGLIKVENSGYLRPTRSMTLILKRIEPYRTKVQLYGKHASLFNQKFFKALDKYYAERAVTYPT